MEALFDTGKQSENLIKKLLLSIEEATQSMNHSFDETILKHEQQFIKCFRIKIYELIKLFDQLKSTIEDKFINNTLAVQLQTVLKQRDYFKYECLKLNSQHQTLLDDYKNLSAQSQNSNEQMAIYKHLLQNEKIRNHQIQSNVEKLKKSFNEISVNKPAQNRIHYDYKSIEVEREIIKVRRDNRDKNQVIRALRERVQEQERVVALDHQTRVQKKQLFELFRICVENWKREIVKGKKDEKKVLNIQQLSPTNKKDLLRILFTHSQFLKFIERLLFDDGFKVTFESTEQNYMQHNRTKLLNYMNKRRIYTTPKGFRN